MIVRMGDKDTILLAVTQAQLVNCMKEGYGTLTYEMPATVRVKNIILTVAPSKEALLTLLENAGVKITHTTIEQFKREVKE